MTANVIMDPKPTVLRPTDTVRTATQYIMHHRYRNLPVVDEEGRYLGVFGVNCLLRLMLPQAVVMKEGLTTIPFIQETLSDLHRRLIEVEDNPISLCINEEVTVVEPDTPLLETLLVLYKTRTSVPVVEKTTRRLVGMISYWDVTRKILAAEV
jgi:CBS-domain-containing membrane protein